MSPFSRLIRFRSEGKIYFSDLGAETIEPPSPGTQITAYSSLENLTKRTDSVTVVLEKVVLM